MTNEEPEEDEQLHATDRVEALQAQLGRYLDDMGRMRATSVSQASDLFYGVYWC